MISINNRRMIVPPEERNLGVFADDYSSVREFSIPRKHMRDIDPSALTFKLDFMYKDGTKNLTVLEKIVTDDEVELTWNIIAEDLRVDGTVLLQVYGNDLNGTTRWATYMEPFYIGNAIDTAGSYTGELSALEALLTRVQIVENAEQDRIVSEQQRKAGETTRVSNESLRVSNENTRVANETNRQSSMQNIETRFNNLTTEQQQDAEVIVARGDKASLGERLDDFDSQLADKAYYYNRSRGQNYKKEIISIFDSVSEWSKYSGFGNTEEDISVFKHGNKSLKIETLTTDTSQTCMLDKSVSLDLTNKIVQLDLYIPDIANLTTVRISLITSNSSLSFVTGRSPTTLKQGWNTISVSAKAFDKQGGATLSNLNDIKKIRITINSAAGTTTTVYLDRLLIYDNGLTKGRVTLAFDDGHSSVFLNAKPIMDRYGYVGVANVITSQHDGNTANRMTLEELKILNDMGWDIASHSHRHIDMTQLTEQEIYEDMSDSKTWLMKNGFFRGAEHFVTPLGYYNDTIINIAKKYFSSHRTNLSGVEAYPIADNYRLKVRNVSSLTAIETIQGWVDLCAESKDWLILLFHYIQEPVDASTVISPAMFRTIVDYIATKDVAVVTNSDMITNEIQSSKADNIENANENGRYIKFIDGTMICTCEMSWGETPITTVVGSLFRSEILQITFPESFVGIPSVGSPTFGGQNLVWWGGGYTTSLGINGYVISPTSVTPEALTGKAVAIGRWK